MTKLDAAKHSLHTRQAAIRDAQRERLDQMHALCHEFMRDMDRAILIHGQLAILDGRNPDDVTSALWPVRTQSPHPQRVKKRGQP